GRQVIYLTDSIDEYAFQRITDYEDHKLQSVVKEGLKFGDEDEEQLKRREKFYREEFKPLTDFLKRTYGSKIMRVAVSQRIESSPSVIVTGQHSYSANMERIVKAQAFHSGSEMDYMFSQRVMEINPRHPIVVELKKRIEEEPESESTLDTAWLLYDTAMATSGFNIEALDAFSQRMYRTLAAGLKLQSLDLLPEAEVPEEDEQEAAAAGGDAGADSDGEIDLGAFQDAADEL
ncbi:unnamed protein product, partial [Phaeothamnion confervicola]